MNQLMSFERRDPETGATGQPVDTWKVFTQAWASVAPISGREYFAASGQRATITHKIRMRFGPEVIKPKDRARVGARLFDIVSILNDNELNRMYTLMVIENVGT